MNADSKIRELVKANLCDDHNVDGVCFIDQLLFVASEVGEIKCTLASDRQLRFQIPNQPAWEAELDRAKAKLRMLCARLGVLCQESGQDVSLYGGESIIERASADSSTKNLLKKELRYNDSPLALEEPGAGKALIDAPLPSSVHTDGSSSLDDLPHRGVKKWKVRFKNTPDEQEFTISTCGK